MNNSFSQLCDDNHSALENALPLCGKEDSYAAIPTFDLNGKSCCINGKSKAYYTFVTNRSCTLITPASTYDEVDCFGLTAFSSINPDSNFIVSSSYKLYGPFELYDNYVDLINNGLISPLASDSPSASAHYIHANLIKGKRYVVEFTFSTCAGRIWVDFHNNVEQRFFYNTCKNQEISCENCIPKFQPIEDRYVVSAWVKELEGSTSGALNYTNASLKVTSGGNVETFHPSGQIIDGWQRIEGIIQTNSLGNLKMELIMDDGTAYFDDIRVSPFDGSMITYVYDPITFRLMAEMDERNYAKIYEYDEEGKLVRVKKETEKGIMTIQENRENSSTND